MQGNEPVLHKPRSAVLRFWRVRKGPGVGDRRACSLYELTLLHSGRAASLLSLALVLRGEWEEPRRWGSCSGLRCLHRCCF